MGKTEPAKHHPARFLGRLGLRSSRDHPLQTFPRSDSTDGILPPFRRHPPDLPTFR